MKFWHCLLVIWAASGLAIGGTVFITTGFIMLLDDEWELWPKVLVGFVLASVCGALLCQLGIR